MKKTLLIAALAFAGAAHAAEHVVEQKGKAFTVKQLKVKQGDAVDFRNADPFSHNVFSLSDPKTFDLGTFGQGHAKKVVFDKPGVVEVECAIHPEMKMHVEVAK